MHTGIENEILATLRVITAQNNELIGLIRGHLDEINSEKIDESERNSELFKLLSETGALDELMKNFARWRAREKG